MLNVDCRTNCINFSRVNENERKGKRKIFQFFSSLLLHIWVLLNALLSALNQDANEPRPRFRCISLSCSMDIIISLFHKRIPITHFPRLELQRISIIIFCCLVYTQAYNYYTRYSDLNVFDI